MENNKVINLLFQIVTALTLLIALGCGGGRMVKPDSLMDNPGHHFMSGVELYEEGNIEDARWEFEWSRELDPEFSPAFTGLGLIEGNSDEFDEAFRLMKKAKKLAKTDEHRIIYHVGMIRLYTLWQGKQWLKKAEGEFKNARKIDSEEPSPYFSMGKAYREAGDI